MNRPRGYPSLVFHGPRQGYQKQLKEITRDCLDDFASEDSHMVTHWKPSIELPGKEVTSMPNLEHDKVLAIQRRKLLKA